MRISTKGRYALRMMLELAKRKDDGFIPLKEIAEHQNISKKYLEQIVHLLNKNNFIEASRGYKGGYRLIREPHQYTVLEVFELAEGSLMPVPCLDDEVNQCERADICVTLPLWKGLAKVIREYLASVTLQDLLTDDKQLGVCCKITL